MRVAPKHLPVLVTSNECDLFNGESGFKKPACAFVTKIVKMKIVDFQIFALPPKCGANRQSVVGENPALPDVRVSSLLLDNLAGVVA